MADGNLDAARERLAESVRLRQEIGFAPGVAAGLLALAELETQAGEAVRARTLLDQADVVAEASGAARIREWVARARAELPAR